MKKIVFIALGVLGVQLSVIAQETETPAATTNEQTQIKRRNVDRPNFYYGFGVNVLSDYKMNDKLKASGMPQIANAAPEFTFGFSFVPSDSRFYHDIEAGLGYMDEKTAGNRIKTTVANVKMRVQYKLIDKQDMFFSAGLDIGYAQTGINLYSRGNTIDLNNLNPATHTGHISMRNGQLTLGPSVALGLFQQSFPVRINAGYNIGVTRGKWKSDFADLANTVNESGQGSFYAKVLIGF
ncbi:hypothetical protein [Flavobacterium cerinum]|uniref:Outer membrane protein beta-barrel domain-containing protein n=1 Tax=Flavobacterium cerinum TaxID=2502784 RepID=A0A3S3R260_9FLAO|nr:hypothetical protein [Flavobacterium cerinum]RWX03517.1 hypothetical protein EPI11_00890 [Flavobacterium cerinum]